MLATTLIVAALVGSSFTPRAVVPSVAPNLSVSATPTAFNPEASPRAAATAIEIVSSIAGTLSVDVVTEAGPVFGSLLSATAVDAGSTTAISWDAAGATDGVYGIRATLEDGAGVTSKSLTPVVVDSTAPTLVLKTPQPALTATGPVAISVTAYDLSGLVRASLVVENQLGDTLGTVGVPVTADAAGATLDWDLRLRQRLLLPGVYRLRVTGRDEAGNVGQSTTRVLRVDRAVKSDVIYSLPGAGPVIGLSFDDCVSEQAWLAIIKAFRAARAHTTFFCNGVNVRSNPTAARATLAGGHSIGSHTWAHPELPTLSATAQANQIQADKDVWWQLAKASPLPFFRPPYGLHSATTDAVIGAEGFAYTALWDVDPSDYLNPPRSVLVERVMSHARPGSIVILHVSATTAAAVPALIRALRRGGLEPQSLDEMFGIAAYLTPRAQ